MLVDTTEREARLWELQPYAERARHMTGWTFEYEPQPLGPPPPWNYAERAHELATGASRVLDLGTGGGERLAEALGGFAGHAVATEPWWPNAIAAARRLGALGVPVVHCSSLALPFAAATFDLVLDRHEEFDPAEVARSLRPGGTALTQQIHPDWHGELREFFPRMTVFDPHHATYPRGLAAAGLRLVRVAEHARPVAYRHLGELVYMLIAAPWTIPNFDLGTDLEALVKLERALRRPEGIVLTDRRYLIEARKPATRQA